MAYEFSEMILDFVKSSINECAEKGKQWASYVMIQHLIM